MSTENEIRHRAHEMLMRAMALEAHLRRDFVREVCAGEPALMKRLLDLLDAADRSEKFLEAPALGTKAVEEQVLPDAVGNYLVIGVLGVGGMATVYEAIQEHPRRRVALKVMHQGITHKGAYLRFQFETETLARLHHPGIAQIYEAGAAQLGHPAPAPFFAMELIPDAVPITSYAVRHALPQRERIVMFASVCDAVHHGHQHGIIHRDLKPANVLVDGDGRAKVIDFGVARTTDASESLTGISDERHLIGTLNYMSPEQCCACADIDIRTDVYSLGIMLYELAYDRLPHDLSGLPIPTALQTIVEKPPRRPEPAHRRADRDLEAIILKAIEKDPNRRYESAAALATDLRRSLNFQAIEAHPPGLLDHCRLFARRHRALVAAGLSIAASILLVAAISTGFAVKLSNEVTLRRVAEKQTIRERDLARWEAYTAQIAFALSAIKTGEFHQMRTRLAAAAYQPRGWEWGFLSRFAERSASTTVAHDAMIMDFAVNHDWTRFATAASDGTLQLWEAQDQRPIATFKSDSKSLVSSMGFTRDGLTLISGDQDGVVRSFDASSLREIEVIARLPSPVRSVAGLSEGRVAAACANGTAKVWALDSRRMLDLSTDQPGGIHGIEVSTDGTLLATYNYEGRVWIRSAVDLTVLHRLEFPGRVNQVRFSSGTQMVAAAGAGGRVLVWNVADGALKQTLEATQGINTVQSLAFSNDGSLIAAGLVHRGILVFSIADGKIVGELGGHTDSVSGVRFRPDDQLLVSTSWDRSLRTWRSSEFESPDGMLTLKGHRDYILGVAFSPDGSLIASASKDATVRLWDPDLAQPIASLTSGSSTFFAVDFSPDCQRIAAGCSDKAVRILSAVTGQVIAELKGNQQWVSSVAFDPSGRRIVAGGQDKSVRVWDCLTKQEQFVLRGHTSRVNSVRFSPYGDIIASGSRDGTVRLWDAVTGVERKCLVGHKSDVFAVLFSHDGRRLYSGSRDQTVRVWDVETGNPIDEIAGHGQYVTCLTLSPDGTRLAMGSWFGEIVLFDVATFDLIASFRAHQAAIRGISFSPDGRWLVSCSYDKTVRLFDSVTRSESDSARQIALSAQANAKRVVRPFVDAPGAIPEAVLKQLTDAGLVPERDPWIRKCVLSAFAPNEDEPIGFRTISKPLE